MKSQGITKVITIHPEGDMNVCRLQYFAAILPIVVTYEYKCQPHGGARGKIKGPPK